PADAHAPLPPRPARPWTSSTCPSVNNPRAPPQVARNDRDSGVLSDDLITRGPVATPAGHVSLPTHREVYGRCFRISAPRVSLPFGSRAFSCVSAFHA